jgi:hypothetical protein
MPPRRAHHTDPAPPPEEVEPPYYVATAPLAQVGPAGHSVLAFQAGDKVPPDLVGPNRWGAQVEVPEVFAGQLAPPPLPPPPSDEPGGDQEGETH